VRGPRGLKRSWADLTGAEWEEPRPEARARSRARRPAVRRPAVRRPAVRRAAACRPAACRLAVLRSAVRTVLSRRNCRRRAIELGLSGQPGGKDWP